MTATNKPTSKADMMTAFPETIAMILGEPNIRELIRTLRHLMKCAESHEYDLSACNLLFVCVPPEIFANYTNEQYPQEPPNPGITPTYVAGEDIAVAANRKAVWETADMRFRDVKTMKSCLVDRFLSLIDRDHKTEFEEHRLGNPGMSFRTCFDWFLTRFGHTDEHDRDDNTVRMKQDWSLQDGWHKLERQIEDGMIYAVFAMQPVAESRVVDIAISVLMRTGLFSSAYKQ